MRKPDPLIPTPLKEEIISMLTDRDWKRLISHLKGFAHAWVRNHADAEDLVQDTAQTTIEKFNKETALAEKSENNEFVKVYAGGVLYNKTRTYRRKLSAIAKRQHPIDEDACLPQPAEAYSRCEKKELLDQISYVINRLDKEDKKLYLLFKTRVSNKEICDSLKIDAETLRKRRQRLIRRMRSAIEKVRRNVFNAKKNGIQSKRLER